MADPPGFVVVANAAAGSTEGPVVREVAGRLAATAPTSVIWTEDESDIDRALEALDGRRLVLVGGDGSLHVGLNRLSAAGLADEPIGIVAAGTGNDFARGAGLPTDDVAGAIDVVCSGRPHRFAAIDVGGSELAHNNAHAGLGLVAAERGTAWKPRLGRFAYPVATLVEGLTYDGVDISVRAGDEVVHDGTALAVLVLLGPSMGGGIEPLPDVDLDAARLEVVVVEPVDVRHRAQLAVRSLRDRLDRGEGVVRVTTDEVTLEAPGALRCDVDGEMRRWDGSVRFAVQPRGWTVMVPPPTP